jgi:hypothetical protein
MASSPTEPSARGPNGASGETGLIVRPYPVRLGQKITIEAYAPARRLADNRGGDRKLRLRCPISHKELDCDRFCSVVTEAAGIAKSHHH